MRALLFLCLVACVHTQPVNPHHPEDDAHPKTDCQAAEDVLLHLQCKDSDGGLLGGDNRAGVPFHTVCEQYIENNVSMRPACIKSITACDQLPACD